MTGFIEQIVLVGEEGKTNENISIDERLHLQEKIGKLTKLIEKTERAAWKEVQSKKKYALFQKLKAYKAGLEDLRRG